MNTMNSPVNKSDAQIAVEAAVAAAVDDLQMMQRCAQLLLKPDGIVEVFVLIKSWAITEFGADRDDIALNHWDLYLGIVSKILCMGEAVWGDVLHSGR